MKKLLLAYDGSPGADAAMSDLAWAGLPPEMEALVFSVADVWLPSNPESPGEVALPGATPAAILKARQEALQAVQSCLALARNAAERLRTLHPGWKVEAGSTGDSPAWAVIRRADEWRADLVVAGSHGRSALERLFLGSVSQKIAAEAHCSVRIVRSGRVPRPGRLRIMVAVDGSRDAEAALTEVASRIWPDFSEFRVVAVLDARLATSVVVPPAARRWVRAGDETARDWVCRLVEAAARRLQESGLQVETQILEGDPKRELVKEAGAWEADAIFIGARGLQHGERLILGSVASAVAARAHCTVEISRPAVASAG